MTEPDQTTSLSVRTVDFLTFDEESFRRFIVLPASRLLLFCDHVVNSPEDDLIVFTWPILAALRVEADKVEEYLDIFGAARNSNWYLTRELTACIKNFADTAYRFFQVTNCFSRFEMLAADLDLKEVINQGFIMLWCTLRRSMKAFLEQSARHGLKPRSDISISFSVFDEKMPHGVLPHDRRRYQQSTAAPLRAGALATQFLNLAVDSEVLGRVKRVDENAFRSLFPDQINEETLRQMELKFHNLQSGYDTYISSTSEENVDPGLRQLRAHISVILRLLEASTLLGHFYERHFSIWEEDHGIAPVVDFPAVLQLLRKLLIAIHRHIRECREICYAILRKYTRQGEVDVPIPQYRGFHVRPSALVMKIVTHYGTDVKMMLGNSEYNAASALDMMRANEWINALKRRKIAEIVAQQSLEKAARSTWDLERKVSRAIHQLAENNSIVVYERPLRIENITFAADTPVAATVLEVVKRLLFTGKIDVETDIKAKFLGDERPLQDIRVLAENQYCEDSFGNNIALPTELPYLRR